MKKGSERILRGIVACGLSLFFLVGRAQVPVHPGWLLPRLQTHSLQEMQTSSVFSASPWLASPLPYTHPEGRPARPAALLKLSLPAGNFYFCQLGFFCKEEWKLEQSSHIPFRFRLGSLAYCDYLEGKGDFRASSATFAQ
jgi:hypothetical protein